MSRVLGTSAMLIVLLVSGPISPAFGGELSTNNPFDPQRKPWPVPVAAPAPLPPLTAQDLQIEGAVVFGSLRGVLVQLDGRLKGVLPANSAGKLRIAEGQTFGPGYVLETVTPTHVVIRAGTDRQTVPIVRRGSRGQPAPIPVPAQAALAVPQPSPGPQVTGATDPTGLPGTGQPVASPVPSIQSPPVAAMTDQQHSGSGANPVGAQPSNAAPKTLLEAIMAAREAANRSQQQPSPGQNVGQQEGAAAVLPAPSLPLPQGTQATPGVFSSPFGSAPK